MGRVGSQFGDRQPLALYLSESFGNEVLDQRSSVLCQWLTECFIGREERFPDEVPSGLTHRSDQVEGTQIDPAPRRCECLLKTARRSGGSGLRSCLLSPTDSWARCC